MRLFFLLALSLIALTVRTQPTFNVNGPADERNIPKMFVNAVIHIDAETVIPNGALIISNGKVAGYGPELTPAPGVEVINLDGRHIYPAFIDLYSDYGIPATPNRQQPDSPQYERNENRPLSWNDALHPEYIAAYDFSPDKKKGENILKAGFGAVLTHRHDGIARGTGALVVPGEGSANELLLQSESAAFYSFRKGSSTQKYPSSLMGAIALLRQTHYDATWYEKSGSTKERSIGLEAWSRIQQFHQIFALTEKNDLPRIRAIAQEFNLNFIVKSAGDEYQRIDEVIRSGFPLIVPLKFPKAYDVSDPYNARLVSLQELKHWEQAPANPAFLAAASIPFSFTAHDIDKPDEVLKNLRKAVQYGLDSAEAIRALTLRPAQFIGADDRLGTLHSGKLAQFIIASGDLFDPKTKILETWTISGVHRHEDYRATDVRGIYNLNLDNHFYALVVNGDLHKPTAYIQVIQEEDTLKKQVKLEVQQDLVSLSFNPKDEHYKEVVRLSGNIHKQSRIWEGQSQLASGAWLPWTAIRQKEKKETPSKKSEGHELIRPGPIWFPNRAYGLDSIPPQETLWLTGATVWTCGEDGIIERGEVLVHKGKIVAVGKRLNVTDLLPKNTPFIEINLHGKHLSPGIIDEHSHIAISRGVNEGTQASTAEVRIGDVVNPDDINIFRHLSGGVTTVQQLHGSANPIGGQSSIIKMRWGLSADEMRMEGAPGFIKFALGENVKQSNWGDQERVRYPQTRMGVEQVYYDHFHRAREYELRMKKSEAASEEKSRLLFFRKKEGPKPTPERVDLDLAAIAEILNEERFISCHSYVQSEINMLMHVGDSMGFRVNTFTHILEGYKVADKMLKHGAGASTFSDWWAYKFEVNDAIPYNAALMHQQGLTVAMNSDDAELARRLNHEAAKAVKYGGVSQEEALKMVTLNPARLLHIDHRVGSIVPGKEADLVIWSDNPLSVYAKVENTFIDGRCYFDRDKLDEFRKRDEAERARILAKMLEDPDKSDNKKPGQNPNDKEYHCDDVDEEI